ncbi:MAG: hypothetical protein R2849_06630 [Thermomicrobiales bacterium]
MKRRYVDDRLTGNRVRPDVSDKCLTFFQIDGELEVLGLELAGIGRGLIVTDEDGALRVR